jgi:hypothetical protein
MSQRKILLPPIPGKVDHNKIRSELLPKQHLLYKIKDLEFRIKNSTSSYEQATLKPLLLSCQEKLAKVIMVNALAYKKKNKESCARAEFKAQKGDKAAILRLIKWDIEYLFKDYAKEQILIAKAVGDGEFLEGVSEALKIVRKKSPQQGILNYLRLLKFSGFNFNNHELVYGLRETLLRTLQAARLPENEPIFRLLLDHDYFNKFLKRHKLRGGH